MDLEEKISWGDQRFRIKELDYSILDKHIEFIRSLEKMHRSAISIFDMARQQHIYLSEHFEDLLGWDLEEARKPGHEYIDSKMHPDDLDRLTRASSRFYELAMKVQREDRGNMQHYKMILDYRTMGKDGKYVRVIEQHKLLELDQDDNFWLGLSILDLSPDHDLSSMCRFRLVNTKTGELFHVPAEEDMPRHNLSIREQEVLQLLSKGLISKQIADQLFISVNTVNTHRQRIIEKLNVNNTAEAIQHAANLGVI